MGEDAYAKSILAQMTKKPAAFWVKKREQNALNLFRDASQRVPAYRAWLQKHKIDPQKIKTFSDFQTIPPISKKTYLKKNVLKNLCWDGDLEKPIVFTSTSGSTGDPFYFPRGHRLDWEYSIIAEFFLKNSSFGQSGPTLVIIGFGMGVWIGGLITYQAFEIAGRRGGHPISILTPGINKKEIFKALHQLAPKFKQTIIVGYPPFVKDIIDSASMEGVNLKDTRVRLLFAAESFPEKLRDYLAAHTSLGNVYTDTMNIYGTADIGAMAFETPTAILLRRLAMKKPKLFEALFGSINKMPTLAQYNPLFMTFEAVDGEILLTGNNTIPLVRYAVGDHGGVLSYSEVEMTCKQHGYDLANEARKVKINSLTKLPFVYVYERNDFSTTLYGLQIYPETIREVLLEKKIASYVTGKCTLITKFNKKNDQFLEINIELLRGKSIDAKTKKYILHRIITNLRMKNSEFKELSDYLKQRANPKLVFWQNEDPSYFQPGVKQKWVKK